MNLQTTSKNLSLNGFLSFKEKAIANNEAFTLVEKLFKKYKDATGISLFISSNYLGSVIFEGDRKDPTSTFVTKKFKNKFSSFIEIHEYFKDVLLFEG